MSNQVPCDPKIEALREQGTLNPSPEDVKDQLFQENQFFDPHDLVQVKYEMLRRHLVEGSAITTATSSFGFSRVAFYQILKRFQENGVVGLLPKLRGPKRAHKLSEELIAFVETSLAENPALRSRDLAQLVKSHYDVSVHPRSIERALVRHQKKRRK
jgi:transposase